VCVCVCVFQKLFRTSMLFHFTNVLLQVLLHKSHDLLQEEITLAVYNMAAVDFDAFYAGFMPEFLAGCQGVDANQRAVLARNFKLERVRGLTVLLCIHMQDTQVPLVPLFLKETYYTTRCARAPSKWFQNLRFLTSQVGVSTQMYAG